uniref:non-specific serine/threonine protein kinase n=1 Tax=Cyclopterus lumpus TaxID=8103 RepID=A0A8C3AGR2_CYCLU
MEQWRCVQQTADWPNICWNLTLFTFARFTSRPKHGLTVLMLLFSSRGKFAVVRKCVEKCTGHEYAAKFMRKRRKGQDCRMEIIHEIAVLELATASHRVVNLHQVYEMASEMVLVLEFAAGGEIFNQCVSDEEDEAFSEEDVKRLMRQILEGVSFLHQNNVVHLDLKPQNILLTSSSPLGDIKIVDFGLSRMVSSHQELREIMGTPEYVAPEVLNYEPISTATDMWSAGVLAYVMLTGISPFLGENKQETFLNISQLNVSYSEEELQQPDRTALSFIQTLLRKQPQGRGGPGDGGADSGGRLHAGSVPPVILLREGGPGCRAGGHLQALQVRGAFQCVAGGPWGVHLLTRPPMNSVVTVT